MAITSVWKPDLTVVSPPVTESFNNASPGVLLDILTGTFKKRSYGSTRIGTLACEQISETAAKEARIRMWGTNIGAAANTRGLFGMWVYFDRVICATSSVILCGLKNSAGGAAPSDDNDTMADRNWCFKVYFENRSGTIKLAADAYNAGANNLTQDLYTLPTKTWFYIQMGWAPTSGQTTYYDYKIWVTPEGGTPTEIYSATSKRSYTTYFTSVHYGEIQQGGTLYDKGGPLRIYAPELYSTAAISEGGVYPSMALTAPTKQENNWYWAANGSDTAGDGTVNYPFLSELNLQTSLADATVLSGDTVHIGVSGGTWDATSEGLSFLIPAGYDSITVKIGAINLLHEITGSWTNTSGHVWQTATTDSTRFARSVLLEDQKWLTKVNAANTSAATSLVEATAGSFYTDGTTWLVHPLASDNPSLHDWHCTVCRSFTVDGGGHFFWTRATNTTFKTYTGFEDTIYGPLVVAKPEDGDPSIAYLFCFSGASTGTAENIKIAGYSKHAIASTTNASNLSFQYKNITTLSGTTYCGKGGQTPFVDYNGQAGTTGNCAAYTGCVIEGNAIVKGAVWNTVGTISTDYSAWISHGTVNSNEQITFADCDLGDGVISAANDENLTFIRCDNVGAIYATGVLIYDTTTTPGTITGTPSATQIIALVDEAAAGAAAQLAIDVAEVEAKKSSIWNDTEILGVTGTWGDTTSLYDDLAGLVGEGSGSGGSGDGDTPVDHNTGGTNALQVTLEDGTGVDNAVVRAYLKSEWDSGLKVSRGTVYTKSDGRWAAPLLLNSGLTYTLVITSPQIETLITEVTA